MASAQVSNNYDDADDDEELMKSLQEERERFGKMSPLPTFVILSMGPLLMQVGSALHDSIDFLIVSRAFGSYGVGVAGLAALIRFVCEGISLYFGFAAIIKIPMLIGENKQAEARQLIVDLYRVGLLMSIPFAIICYFISEPMLKYMGCPEFMLHDSLTYITPITTTIPFLVLLQLAMGVIQGEGRSVLCGILQVSVFVLNCGVISPIILFGAGAPVTWSGVGYALSHALPGIVLTILIFCGKFSLKPKLSLLKNPINPNVWDALKLASSFLVFLVTNTFPPMLMVHYLLLAAGNIGEFEVVNAVFNVVMKTTVFVGSWTEGFSQGFMAAGSYATGARDIFRFAKLAFWGFFFCFVFQVIFMPLMIADPWVPSSIWLTSESEKDWARRMNGIPFYTQFLQSISEVTNCVCMSFGNAWAPLVPAVVKGVLEIGASIGLYEHGGGDTHPERIVYVYPIMDCSVFLIDVIYFFVLILPYVRKQVALVEQDKDGGLAPTISYDPTPVPTTKSSYEAPEPSRESDPPQPGFLAHFQSPSEPEEP
jgi:Na+-driven multidrug efflux pump